MRVAAVCFDLFETVVTEFDRDWRPGRTAARWLGVEPTAFAAAWEARRHRRHTGEYADYVGALRDICQELRHPTDEAVLRRIDRERRALKARPFRRVDPAVRDLVLSLRGLGVKLAVVSNCAPEEVAAWPACDLAAMFDAAVFSYEERYVKPQAPIYLRACERLGVEPQQVCFVGDGGADELDGADAVGMRPYWATWFLDRWPRSRRDHVAGRAGAYPELRSPGELLSVLHRT